MPPLYVWIDGSVNRCLACTVVRLLCLLLNHISLLEYFPVTGVPQEAVSGSPSCFVTVGPAVAQTMYQVSLNQGQFNTEKLISDLLFAEGGWGVTAAVLSVLCQLWQRHPGSAGPVPDQGQRHRPVQGEQTRDCQDLQTTSVSQ